MTEIDTNGSDSDVQHFVDADGTEGGEERPDDFAEAPQLRVGHLVQHGSHEIEVGQTHFSSSFFLPNPIPKANMKSIVILFIPEEVLSPLNR